MHSAAVKKRALAIFVVLAAAVALSGCHIHGHHGGGYYAYKPYGGYYGKHHKHKYGYRRGHKHDHGDDRSYDD